MPRFSDFQLLFEVLERLFDTSPYDRHMIMGDINIDVSSSTTVTKNYLNLFKSYGYQLCNDQVTRPQSGTFIDHVFSNFTVDSCYTMDNQISDHCGIFTHFHLRSIPEVSRSEYCEVKVTNYQEMNHKLISILYNLLRPTNLDASEKVEFMMDSIVSTMNDCSRTVLRRVYAKEGKHCPWFDKSISRLCGFKRRLLRKQRPFDETTWANIRDLEYRMRNLIGERRRDYYLRKLRAARSTRETWKELNSMLGRKRSATVVKRLLDRDRNRVLTKEKEISDSMNRFLSQ